MSLGKRLFIGGEAAADAACSTDTVDIFGDSSGIALYSLDYDASDASGNYDGKSTNVEFGVVPMIPSADAQDFYRAQLTKIRGWNGSSDLVAAVRRRNNKISQVFFCMELHRFDRNAGDVDQLIGEIFTNEF